MTDGWLIEWQEVEAAFYVETRHAALQSLPRLATNALTAGWDSPSLRLLAGETSATDTRELRDLFSASLTELGRAPIAADEAFLRLVRFHAARIASGQTEPIQGMRQIAAYLSDAIRFGGEVEDIVVAFDMLDDEVTGGWGRRREEIEPEIIDLARTVAQDS